VRPPRRKSIAQRAGLEAKNLPKLQHHLSRVTQTLLPDAQPELIDLMHMGRPHLLGAWRLGDVIVDPGPSTCLGALLPVLERHPPRVLALTHVHLDHAGASGSLIRRFPDAEVWVHELGAPHLIDPARLLRSAGRLYGGEMERMWGEVLPVRADRLRVLRGGEMLASFRVAHTPGHASHHVSYLHEPSRWAFTGDVTGVRIGEGSVLAPTPPPDVDLQAWRASLDLIEGWRPDSLALTHFGAYEDVAEHLAALREHLDQLEEMGRDLDEAAYADAMRARVAGPAGTGPGAATAAAYAHVMPLDQSFQGLMRCLHRRERAL
jgi:glyoxylase-like metal-dependent hydrolase (beta-lactamase superfamily II)